MLLDRFLNFAAYIAWIGFFFLVLVLALRAFQYGGIKEVLKALTTWRVLLVFLLAVGLSLLSSALVFIEPQNVGVVISLFSRTGYREQPVRSGLHWIMPLAEQVVSYPIYWQTYTMSSEPLEGTKVGDDSIAARSSDGQAVYLDSSVIFRIDPNEVIRVHIDFQDRYVEDYIRPILRGLIRTEVSQFTADEVNSSKRKDLEANLDEQLRQAMGEKGFVLDRFLLRNIAFSQQYASAIEQKQVAEQERTKREYEAEQMRTLAGGQRDRTRIEAQGRADATVLEGQAEADVILLKARAEAEALRLISQAIEQNPKLLTYRYIDKLSPALKAMLLPSDNPLLLPLPDMGLLEEQAQAESTSIETNQLPVVSTPESMLTPLATPTATPAATPTATPMATAVP
ncbi:MAG: SPFH domain-containing protein [Anaerolineales bacterium]